MFAYDLPWDKIDVATFSWQKVLGGEGGHGVLILGPRAVERLESYTPGLAAAQGLPPDREGRARRGRVQGRDDQHARRCSRSRMRSVALEWAKSVGGLDGLIARTDANAAALDRIVEERDWLGHLAADPASRSKTSVCLTVEGADERLHQGASPACSRSEGAAYDIAGYRDAPPGLRIWCGATVDTADIEALGPWLDWAWASLNA